MSPDILLLKLLCSYDLWTQHRSKLPDYEEPFIKRLYRALDGLLEEVGRDVSLDELEAFYGANFKPNSHEEEAFAKETFTSLRETEVGEDVINSILAVVRDRASATRLASVCIDVIEGRKTFEVLSDEWGRELDSRTNLSDEEDFVTDDLDLLYESTIAEGGLRWRLNWLNKSLGPLRKGDFGFIFARPETGKTTFLASEVSFMAEQVESPILWFNNEEQGSKVALRVYQASLGLTLNDLIKDRHANYQKYMELTKGYVRIVDSASIHRRKVEQLCKKYKPSLVIFDQIDKLKGFSADREDLHLGAIYIWAREIAKTYCPVIGVCQAAGTAENKQFLTMDDVANAKTAKQAEADFILPIGKIHADGYEFARYFNICKNKLVGGPDIDPELRHGKTMIKIRPEIARYEDL